MSRNPGKNWEEDFYNSFEGDERHRLLRLYDTTNGFKGVANPCDFVYYQYPCIVYLELKSVQGTRLPFSSITDKQWESLSDRNQVYGALGAIFVQFRETKESYLVPISVLKRLREEGRKSVTRLELQTLSESGWTPDTRVKRVSLNYKISRCSVDTESFKFALFILSNTKEAWGDD